DRPRRAPRRGAEGLGGAADPRVHSLNRRGRQRRGDRERDAHVAQRDRLPRVQPPHAPQRPAPGQEAEQQQAGDDGGEGERGVDERKRRAASPERTGREEKAEWEAEGARDQRGRDGDLQGEQADGGHVGPAPGATVSFVPKSYPVGSGGEPPPIAAPNAPPR